MKLLKAIPLGVWFAACLGAAWWWMFWTPGDVALGPLQPLNADQLQLESHIQSDVASLASTVGQRNVPDKPEKLAQAAAFIESSLQAVGYQPQSQWYTINGDKCRNIAVEIPGSDQHPDVVVIGAHYDTVPESPGADDNSSGVAVTLALARSFAGTHPARTLRFVAFTNEEPPYFWRPQMGSLVYAKKCRAEGDHVVAMLSIESVGFYSSASNSQRYPAGLGLFFPSQGNFIGFVGNLTSRSLVHQALGAFRRTRALPSIGAAVPGDIDGVGWSDHWSFWQQGFPAIEITDTAPYRNPYYHTPGDTPNRLNYDYLARFTWGMRAVVRSLANSK